MIGAVIALCVSTIVGALVVRAIGGETSSWLSMAGESILIGVGCSALLLEILSIARLPWSLLSVGLSLVAAGAVLAVVGMRRGRVHPTSPLRFAPAAFPFDFATVLLLAGYATFATLVRLPEHDFLAIWGLKGRTFWEAGGIDWHFLTLPWNDFSHPDYPLFLPLVFDFVALFNGGWEDRWIGLLYPGIGAAALLVARAELARSSSSPLLLSIATFGLAGFALTPWVGLADGVVAVYALAALSILRRGLDGADGAVIVRGGLLLGFAAMTKNEGTVTLLAYALAAVVFTRDRWRTAGLLAVSLVIPLPWWIARAVLGIDSGLLRGSLLERFASNMTDPVGVIRALAAQHILSLWAVAGIATAFGLSLSRRRIHREAFAMTAVALQGVMYAGAYFVASYELEWLVRWSWERVASQFILPLAFVASSVALRAAENR